MLDGESTSLTLIQRRNSVVCPLGSLSQKVRTINRNNDVSESLYLVFLAWVRRQISSQNLILTKLVTLPLDSYEHLTVATRST